MSPVSYQEGQGVHLPHVEGGAQVFSEDSAGLLPEVLGGRHSPLGVETRCSHSHPQARQTQEVARQLPTHLPHFPSGKGVREGDQTPSRMLLRVQESLPCVSGRLPTGAGCHGPSGKAGRTHREGVREEEGPLVLIFRRFSSLGPGLARQAAAETPENRHFW